MALVTCPKCEATISEKALACPKCGYATVCDECNTALPIYHQGACPECGNPEIQGISFTEETDIVVHPVDENGLGWRIILGLSAGLIFVYLGTAGFEKLSFFYSIPIIGLITLIGVFFPQLTTFLLLAVIAGYAGYWLVHR